MDGVGYYPLYNSTQIRATPSDLNLIDLFGMLFKKTAERNICDGGVYVRTCFSAFGEDKSEISPASFVFLESGN